MKIPDQVKRLHGLFARAGFSVRLVGGAVRDAALGETPKDFDLCTDATPEQMDGIGWAAFGTAGVSHLMTGVHHGTVTFIVDKMPIEVTTLRVDLTTDGRHAEVEFTKDWRADAARRDFTINAMSMDLETGELFDYFGGVSDLEAGVIRFIGDANQRINEDYLRILRYFRFWGRYGVPKGTPIHDEAALSDVENIKALNERISNERIWMELAKILADASAPLVIWEMIRMRVLEPSLPMCFDQSRFTKTCQLSDNPITRLARLATASADAVQRRLNLSTRDIRLLEFLTRWRDGGPPTLSQVKSIATTPELGKEFALEYAALQGDIHTFNYLQEWAPPVFPVQGRDLLEQGMTPGRGIGARLRRMEQHWRDHDYRSRKEELLAVP